MKNNMETQNYLDLSQKKTKHFSSGFQDYLFMNLMLHKNKAAHV